jgi:hypothetical protein
LYLASKYKGIKKGGAPMEEFLNSAIQSGFSVVVAAYLLIRMEKRLEALSEAIRDLHAWLRTGTE